MLHSRLLRFENGMFGPEHQPSWFFLLVFTIYTWSQSMLFVFEYYLGFQWASFVSRGLLIYLSLHLGSIFFVKLPKTYISIAFFYIGLLFLYAFLEFVLGNGDQLLKGVLKTSIVILLMLRIVSTRKCLNKLIALNFIFGFILVAFNTIPLLGFSGLVELHGASISRVGGELLNPNLDPISYGIFGLTENHVDPGKHFPRLQGWSSEPQHWAYLIFYVLSFGVLLTKLVKNKTTVFLLLSVVCVHFFFIGSTAANLSFMGVFVGILLIVGLDRIDYVKSNHWSFLFLIGLTPGLIIPFCLGTIPLFDSFFLHFNLMGEGQNWIQKLSFLDYGSGLYFRAIPVSYDEFHSTHNFILNTYLDFGYVFLMPLIFFLYRFSRSVVSLRSGTLLLASGFWLVSNTLLDARGFYLPMSGVFFMIVMGLAIGGYAEEAIENKLLQNVVL